MSNAKSMVLVEKPSHRMDNIQLDLKYKDSLKSIWLNWVWTGISGRLLWRW